MLIRFIVELDTDETEVFISQDNPGDDLTDTLINTFDTPHVSVLDIVDESDVPWHRSSRF